MNRFEGWCSDRITHKIPLKNSSGSIYFLSRKIFQGMRKGAVNEGEDIIVRFARCFERVQTAQRTYTRLMRIAAVMEVIVRDHDGDGMNANNETHAECHLSEIKAFSMASCYFLFRPYHHSLPSLPNKCVSFFIPRKLAKASYLARSLHYCINHARKTPYCGI